MRDKKVAVGLHAFGGSVALVAQELGFEIAAILDSRGGRLSRSNSIYARVCERTFGSANVHTDEHRQWKNTVTRLQKRGVDLLFGQPQFGGMNGMRREADPAASEQPDSISLLGSDGEDFVRLAQELKPRAIVIFGTGKLQSSGRKYIDMLSSQLSEYRWSTMTTNAVLHGVPQDRRITVVVGARDFYFNPTIPMMIKPNELPTCWSALADLFQRYPDWDGREAAIMEIDGKEVTHHVIPQRKDSLASQLLWGAADFLSEGQSLFDVRDLNQWPSIVRFKQDRLGNQIPRLDPSSGKPAVRWEEDANGNLVLRGLMKGQLPVRLHPALPAPTIYGIERYIHPAANRPLSLRELARLFCLPDDYYLGSYYQPAMKIVGSTVPLPVSRWVISDLLKSMVGKDPVSPPQPGAMLFDIHATAALSEQKRVYTGKWVESYERKKSSGE